MKQNNNWAQDLIAMMDELGDVYDKIGLHKERQISFPKIVVVGNQSSGKSSVLERIVGHDFLPRGTDTVTCMPIELRLHYVSNDAKPPRGVKDNQDWVVFEHKEDKPFTDFTKVRAEIQAQFDAMQTDESNKTISSVPLVLNIYSENVVNITLVDLPGLIAVRSDNQSETLKEEIDDLAKEYIEPENTLILAVCAANQDLNNDMALGRVKDVDPNHKRTLMVLTKIDIMDHGTDAELVLSGKSDKWSFDLGVVGVINRSQKENDEKMTSKDCLEKEQEFFSTQPKYIQFKNKSGIDYLCKVVNKVLIDKIKVTLPREENKIREMIQDKINQLEKLAKPVAEEDRKTELTKVLNDFDRFFKADVKGDEKISGTDELNTGAKIFDQYLNLTTKLNAIDPTDNLTEGEIEKAWRNAMTYKTPFTPITEVFGVLVRKRIKRFMKPCSTTVNDVYQILKRYLDSCDDLKLKKDQFPNMVCAIEKVFNQVLHSHLKPTEDRVNDMLKAELDCLTRWNVDFASGSLTNKQKSTVAEINEIFANKAQKINSQCYAKSTAQVSSYANAANPGTANPETGDASAVQLFGMLINDYFNIVLKKVQDSMQKYINLFLIDAILDGDDGLLNKLTVKLNCESRLDELFRESEKAEKLRSETNKHIETLEKALETIDKVKSAA